MSSPVIPPAIAAAQRNVFDALANSIRDAARPHGCLEDFACQRLAYAQWHFERAAKLAMQFEEGTPEFFKYQKLSLSWEASFNRAMRHLRDLQTLRAQSNPSSDTPLWHPTRKGRVADPGPAAAPDPQPQQNQNFAKRNPQQEVGRNSPCPCGSGLKYKRCCGVNAPPILNQPAGSGSWLAEAYKSTICETN